VKKHKINAELDEAANKKQLAHQLRYTAIALRDSLKGLGWAWNICVPHMTSEELK
jgi:hypothetical protein